jgi:DNA-binding GntR family transcriptional regulator
MLFCSRAARDERAELLKLAIRVDMLAVQPEGNRSAYLGLHEKLHRRIAECARCAALSEAIARASALASTWLCATRPPAPGNPPEHHETLLKTLTGDDPVAAGEEMRKHIRASMQNAMRRLEPYFQMQQSYPQNYSRAPRKKFVLESLIDPENEGGIAAVQG